MTEAGKNADHASYQADATGHPRREIQSFCHVLIFASFFIGFLWFLIHPLISVSTGELKCRGLYIDENSLLSGNFDVKDYANEMKITDFSSEKSVCSTIAPSRSNIMCVRHQNFDLIKIVPLSSPTEPTEAIALTISPPYQFTESKKEFGWTESTFHRSILNLIHRLSDPTQSPWLAKSVFIVVPIIRNETEFLNIESYDQLMEDTVINFLTSYLGHNLESLPHRITFPILRNVVVINLHQNVDNTLQASPIEIKILPQGRRGLLPNLDLVSAIAELFSLHARSKTTSVSFHPNQHQFEEKLMYLSTFLPLHFLSKQHTSLFEKYVKDLSGMISFAISLAVGPYPPHAKFLEHGIDSLTIQIDTTNDEQNAKLPSLLTPEIESIVRMLSSLHERLHHSVTQYLLPSSTTFVSNGEYTLSSILLLLPFLIRPISIIIDFSMKESKEAKLGFLTVAKVACIAWGLVSLPLYVVQMFLASRKDTRERQIMSSIYIAIYFIAFFLAIKVLPVFTKQSTIGLKKNMQCFCCLMTLYSHVPLALAHVSLAVPSILFWCPLFAFPFPPNSFKSAISREKKLISVMKILIVFIIWLISLPPFKIIEWFKGTYTIYLIWIFTPSHFLLGINLYHRYVNL